MKQSPGSSEIILYTTPDGGIRVDTIIRNETIWLTSWRGSIVRKYDVGIAKNYLNEEDMKELEEIEKRLNEKRREQHE